MNSMLTSAVGNISPPGVAASLKQGDAVSIANLGISQSSQPIPLRKKWEKSLESEIHVFRPLAVGEGKDKIYVISSDRNLRAFDLSGKQLWEKNLATGSNSNDYEYWDHYFSRPVEDKQGRIWVIRSDVFYFEEEGFSDSNVTLLRYWPETGAVETRPLNNPSILPVQLDEKGNAYVADDANERFSDNLELKTISSPRPDLMFLIKDKPYSFAGDKMYQVDFDKGRASRKKTSSCTGTTTSTLFIPP